MIPKRPKEVISLIKFYREAAQELVLVIKSYEGSPFQKTKIEKLKQIENILTKLDKKNVSWINKNIPKFYREGKSDSVEMMKNKNEKEFKVVALKADVNMIRVLSEDAYLKFATTLRGVGVSAETALNRIQKAALQDRIVKNVIQGKATEATKKELLKELQEQGWTAFRSTKGNQRRFELLDYVDILSRSQLAEAQNRGLEQGYLNAGRKYVRVVTLTPDIDGHDICNEHEGKIYDLLEDQGNLPPFHVRCRHYTEPVSFAELQKEKPELYNNAVDFYKKSI